MALTTHTKPLKSLMRGGLGFALGNAVKYIARAGHKPADTATAQTMRDKEIEDLRKALWYVSHRIDQLEKEREGVQRTCP